MNMELSKNDTKMLQGLSILAMIWLHLFDTYNYEGLFQPLIFIKGIPLSFYIGQLSDFCVFGFAFCSGYAHMKLFEKPHYYRKRLKSLLILMINFWIVLGLFTIVSVCIGQSDIMPGTLSTFLGNAFLYNMSYNGAWWYLWAYALLVVISPLVLRFVKKAPTVLVFILGLILYCIAYFFRIKLNSDNYFLIRFGPFGMTLFEYIVGCIAFKHAWFPKLRELWKKIPFWIRLIGSMMVILGLLFSRTLFIPSLFVAPISGFIIMTLFTLWKKPKWVEASFLFVGNHSTNIWLTHMFFYLVMFVNLAYIVKYPLLIFLFMLCLTFFTFFIIKLIEKPLLCLITYVDNKVAKQ